MLEQIYKDTKEKMIKSVEAVQREFSAVRAGKATPHLLDTIKVDAYGSSMPLNQVATINAPEPRLIVVQAFDKTTVPDIAKAIQNADLGLNPLVDGATIRIPIPALNEERRMELVKHCKHVAEEGKIGIRNARKDANDAVKTAQKDKSISEDQEADGHDEVQKLTDELTKKIDSMLADKEKEVMQV